MPEKSTNSDTDMIIYDMLVPMEPNAKDLVHLISLLIEREAHRRAGKTPVDAAERMAAFERALPPRDRRGLKRFDGLVEQQAGVLEANGWRSGPAAWETGERLH